MKYHVTEGWELKFAEALKKVFDRSFTVTVDKLSDGRYHFEVAEQDAGGPIMTVGDVAALLQMDRAQVRQLCKRRQQLGPNALPLFKVAGKVRFKRDAVMKWIDEMTAESSSGDRRRKRKLTK